jgi:hypothetical protein
MTLLSATVPVCALLFLGCSSEATAPAVDHSSTTTVAAITTVDLAAEQIRIDQILAFDSLRSQGSISCGDLSLLSGGMLLDASGTEVLRAPQIATPLSADQLNLVFSFGSALPSFTCTDIPSEVRIRDVEETWQATTSGGTFTVIADSINCSVATLEVHDVNVVSPSGKTVPIGDVFITNPAWQMWHPSECQLSQ